MSKGGDGPVGGLMRFPTRIFFDGVKKVLDFWVSLCVCTWNATGKCFHAARIHEKGAKRRRGGSPTSLLNLN